MATSTIPITTDNKHFKKIFVQGNGSADLQIGNDKAYLITMMTSENTSGRVIVITRRDSYVSLLEVAKGNYQSYFTETLSNNVWHVECRYYTIVSVIEF